MKFSFVFIRMFVAKREVTEEWRKLHNEELHKLYFALEQIF
jgi:hypothetical protein